MSWNLLAHALSMLVGLIFVSITRSVSHIMAARLSLRHIPGPPSSSYIWGEEWVLYHSIPGSPYLGWHKQFGKVVKFTGAFGHQVLSITDSRAISFILGEGIYSFPKPHGVRAWFKATLGEGILWVEGKDAHEKQRRILAPALSHQSVRNLTPVFHETSAKVVAQWAKIFDQSHSEEVAIEITNWAGRFALDTIGRAAFSYNFNCLSGEHHDLAEALDGLTNNENKRSSFYMRALFWIFPPILSIGEKGEMIRRSKQELGDIASKMWRDAKIAGDSDGRNLMAIMLRADLTSSHCMNEDQIVAQMRTTISAGYETVSAMIAWVLYEVASNADLQTELREEVSNARDASFDDLNNKYPLLDSVLKETLRLHPAILENHHEAAETMTVPLSEPLPGSSDMHIIVPKGTILAIPINVLQTDTEVWGSDADVFRPGRWVEGNRTGARPIHELLTFSQGPRSCVGKAFAIAEIKALTIALLHHFSFTCPHEIEPFQSFVVRPRVKGQGPSSLPLLVRKL
ncbi:cytochrome P450 [Collybia nuda]|uniref:Cytochrome P450 n=1 Tax=Collybia nuda TaxID=64659 RepID=A0A9P5XW75_9AGAR|nr:cytochrome P450 [Collybia nuda]